MLLSLLLYSPTPPNFKAAFHFSYYPISRAASPPSTELPSYFTGFFGYFGLYAQIWNWNPHIRENIKHLYSRIESFHSGYFPAASIYLQISLFHCPLQLNTIPLCTHVHTCVPRLFYPLVSGKEFWLYSLAMGSREAANMAEQVTLEYTLNPLCICQVVV